MIARIQLEPTHVEWNRRWGAPNGRRTGRLLGRIPNGERLTEAIPQLRGYFGFQVNSETREAEYPWAFFATPLEPDMRALDLGGSLGGLQFVLDRCGLEVTNVDPGEEAHGMGWPVNQQTIDKLNRAFGTKVKLVNQFLENAQLPSDHFHRVFSISTIEHIPPTELPSLMQEIYRIVMPGGFVVLTIDLFLNVAPFTNRERNSYGSNIDVKWLTQLAPFELIAGEKRELYGFPEFSASAILARLEEFLVGKYPAMAQMLCLRKPLAAK